MTATVQFGSVTMQGGGPVSDGMFVVERRFFDDWYTVPDSKEPIRERPAQDGAFGIDRDWRTGLAMVMPGRFRGDQWPAMLAELQTIATTGTPVNVTVSDDMGTTSRAVQVRKFVPHPMPGAKLCTFEVDLFAVDNRRYGAVQAPSTGLPTAGSGQPWPQVWPVDWGTGGTDGRVTVENTGSASTSPLLIVSGGLPAGVELVEVTTGSYLRLDRVIPDGSVVYFDTRTSRIYLDSPVNDISGFASRRDWAGFQIPAFSTRIIQFNGLGTPTGTPTLTVNFSPAY